MKNLFYTTAVSMLLLFAGCRGTISIQQSEGFVASRSEMPKIICISPRFYYEEDAKNYELKKNQRILKGMKKDIVKFAKRNKLNVEIRDLDENANSEFYHDLLGLRQNMLAVNFNQQTPLNFSRSGKSNKIQKNILVYPPRISHDFITYSKTYGTPYFSYIGIYASRRKLLLYHVMVDTDKGETVYREIKTVKSKVNTKIMAQMVYDSYAMLKKQLK